MGDDEPRYTTPESCWLCSHNDEIPDDCPIWKLNSEQMIKEFNNKNGVYDGCTNLKRVMSFEDLRKYTSLFKMAEEYESSPTLKEIFGVFNNFVSDYI